MLSDDLLQKAMKAQEVALIFAGKSPENYEIGMRAYRAAQRIIDVWDAQQCAIYKQQRGNDGN